jgi:AcrR family transcriptional regulator
MSAGGPIHPRDRYSHPYSLYVSLHTDSMDVNQPPDAPDPARPRTKAGQREATKAALTAAARELFAEHGYAGVGTEEIVQRAGVTRGALYHHFRGGKEDLFRAVLVQISAETVQRIAEVARSTEDPWQSLVLGCDAFLDACASREVQRIVLVDAPAVLGWDVRRAIDRDYGLGLLEAALQRAMDAGRLREGSALSLAYVLVGALDEAAMVVAQADDPLAARAEMGQTVQRLLDGLRGP